MQRLENVQEGLFDQFVVVFLFVEYGGENAFQRAITAAFVAYVAQEVNLHREVAHEAPLARGEALQSAERGVCDEEVSIDERLQDALPGLAGG